MCILFLGQCDETPVLDFGEVAPGELASLWVRLDNVGETSLTFASWMIETTPIDIRVTNSFNSDAGQGTMSVLPNVVEKEERLWVSIRLLPGLAPGPLPQETLKLVFEVDKADDYEIEFQLEGEITGCPTGYADCDNDMQNGCEQDIYNDVANCGSCGNVCSVPYGVGSCVEGQCVYDCNDYYTGTMCDQDIDECSTNTHNCDENATCSNRLEGYNCECNEGYEGDGFTCDPIPAKTDTISAVTVVKAGDTLTVACNVYDSWNGLMPPSEESWLEAPDGFTVANVETGTFSVRHTVAGVYSLKCHIRDVVDATPLVLQVVPNDPHDWIVVFDDSDCQGLNSLLDFQVTVTDVYDNIISNPEIVLVSDAVDGLEAVAGGQYRWAIEGDHRVTLSVAEPHDPNAEPLTAFFDVIIDATPPVITITSPERASMITGAATSMTVDMEIVDLLTPVSSVSVNDQDLTVSTGLLVQNLASVQNANWGLNVIRAYAQDACGNERTTVQSYLYGESYYQAATSSHNNAKVTNGLIMQLNQDVFDDGDRADIDDLATLAQAVIQNIDFNAMFTNPIVHSDGFDSNGDGARDQQTFNDCGATWRSNYWFMSYRNPL